MKKKIGTDSLGRPVIIWESHTCTYCDYDQYPHGKIIDPADKDAHKTSKGDWKCGYCTIKDLYKMNKR